MSGTKIKICGLFRPQDAKYVNDAMPDYAGFVFYEKSRRYLPPEEASKLREAIDPKIRTVGVFVGSSKEQIAQIYREGSISIIQLHGDENDAYLEELRGMLPGAEIWKAHKIRSEKTLEAAAKCVADRVLLDNGCGTGERFDWSLLLSFRRPFILAGGLTPENIPEAVKLCRPYALDVSSGVETDGVKDGYKILSAVRAARKYEISRIQADSQSCG
ncbi:phosphoribosylanthranilate isomerase [Papillibacter cinnamivorans]|uniref:N-(5'-phosphoribosyl)anthranilate isomerase n=1 Tax=Papillibacter cinnamivorans DSM 12816 TaxID=1122930 RepID=A0A1W2CNG8_9FIRM|nr:phosphoribosylanthranilate isomerase [Papillibacter cinnamivorans]SMC86759.1 phosphoribosylanthranilate isomerase [Papillibacter cinnamivorans DSM 12816]